MFEDTNQFYPTPRQLIEKMLKDIDFHEVRTVLEPSAGSGSIAKVVLEKFKQTHYRAYGEKTKYDIDCIEIDKNLRYILEGEGFRVVHDDFLTYESYKKYDLIVLNPPFNNGDKHVLKALDLIKNGGKVVAIINSETLKNPYSNSRKVLVQRLKELNASIEYLQEEFVEAERVTDVEIALIKVTIENTKESSLIIEQLKQEEQFEKSENQYNSNTLIDADFLKGIIQQYNFEIKAGLNLISEYKSLQPLLLKSFKKDGLSGYIFNLSLDNSKYDNSYDTLENGYIKRVRYKYWEALFSNEQFTSLLTSNLLQDFRSRLTELKDYDFSYYNIKELQLQMNKNVVKGVEETILNLFEEFSYKHSWYAETSSNIHYFNGWKTNKAWMINKKVIIPLNAYDSWDGTLNIIRYGLIEKMKDIEHVFDYLDNGNASNIDLKKVFDDAQKTGQTKNIKTKYFSINVYKKGTCHITFLDEELLKKFNIFGCQRKGFLPPSYGKTKYKDMTKEEQETINEFEGEESYNKTIKDTDYYIYNPNKILMLEG